MEIPEAYQYKAMAVLIHADEEKYGSTSQQFTDAINDNTGDGWVFVSLQTANVMHTYSLGEKMNGKVDGTIVKDFLVFKRKI